MHTKETLKTLISERGKTVLEAPEVRKYLADAGDCVYELADVQVLDPMLVKGRKAEFRARLEYMCVHSGDGRVDTDNKIIVTVSGSAERGEADDTWTVSGSEVVDCSRSNGGFEGKDTDPMLVIPIEF